MCVNVLSNCIVWLLIWRWLRVVSGVRLFVICMMILVRCWWWFVFGCYSFVGMCVRMCVSWCLRCLVLLSRLISLCVCWWFSLCL